MVTSSCQLACSVSQFRHDEKLIQLTLFEVGAIPSGNDTVTVAVSRSRKSRKRGLSKFTQISRLFKLAVKLNIPLNAKVVVWHGRVEMERKGLDILLQAWQQLCYEQPKEDLRLLAIGTGSDAERFHQYLDKMQLQGVMWLNEFVSDRTVLQTYLCAADVFAFPSRHEGFPVAPIEAMSCGLPVVAADATGIPDIFEASEAYGGVIVPRENTMALAAALGDILDNQERGLKLGLSARDRAITGFAPEVIGKRLRDVLLSQSFIAK